MGDDNDFNLGPLAKCSHEFQSNPHAGPIGLMLFGPISYMERGELQHSIFEVLLGMSGAFGVAVAEILCAKFRSS